MFLTLELFRYRNRINIVRTVNGDELINRHSLSIVRHWAFMCVHLSVNGYDDECPVAAVGTTTIPKMSLTHVQRPLPADRKFIVIYRWKQCTQLFLRPSVRSIRYVRLANFRKLNAHATNALDAKYVKHPLNSFRNKRLRIADMGFGQANGHGDTHYSQTIGQKPKSKLYLTQINRVNATPIQRHELIE